MDNFFFNTQQNSSNFSRTYSKGTSFKFSIGNADDVYNRDEFVGDFVKHNQKLGAALKTSNNIAPSVNSEYWELVLEGVSNMEFRQVGNRIEGKYIDQDDSQGQLLFELDSVSEEEILEMLDDLNIKYKNPYDTELSDTSTNAVQNKVITKVLNDQNKTIVTKFAEQDLKISENCTNQNTTINSRLDVQDATIENNTSQINILVGDGEGSVFKSIKDEIAKVIGGAPEAYDTLKEIANYIAEDKDGVVEVINRLNNLESVTSTTDERMTVLENKIVVMSESEYESSSTIDPNKIYFLYEEEG